MENKSKPRVLLVDDNPPMRATVAGILQSNFDVVGSVSDGGAAVEAANRLVPEILVLDVSMPILSGIDVARQLRMQGCEAKIVFVSLATDVD